MTRKASGPFLVAHEFVTKILHRTWIDKHEGAALMHAKSLLQDYELDDVLGCLRAIEKGIFDFTPPLQSLAGLRKYDPPLMDRWFTFKSTPPPVYMKVQYQNWLSMVTPEGQSPSEGPKKAKEKEWQPPLFPPSS